MYVPQTPTPVLSAKRAAAKKANAAITLLWRAESYHYYGMLRKKYAEEPIYLLAPELLIPMITLYKTLMKRMEDNGVKWDGPQSAPTGFMGIAFLMQARSSRTPTNTPLCGRVSAYSQSNSHTYSTRHATTCHQESNLLA